MAGRCVGPSLLGRKGDKMDQRDLRYNCHDCGVLEGQLHEWECPEEPCPFCGQPREVVICECRRKYIDPAVMRTLDSLILEDDEGYDEVSGKVSEMWKEICEKKGRFPFVWYPRVCARCGEVWPYTFYDPEWNQYIAPDHRRDILCFDCYLVIKTSAVYERCLGQDMDKEQAEAMAVQRFNETVKTDSAINDHIKERRAEWESIAGSQTKPTLPDHGQGT